MNPNILSTITDVTDNKLPLEVLCDAVTSGAITALATRIVERHRRAHPRARGRMLSHHNVADAFRRHVTSQCLAPEGGLVTTRRVAGYVASAYKGAAASDFFVLDTLHDGNVVFAMGRAPTSKRPFGRGPDYHTSLTWNGTREYVKA